MLNRITMLLMAGLFCWTAGCKKQSHAGTEESAQQEVCGEDNQAGTCGHDESAAETTQIQYAKAETYKNKAGATVVRFGTKLSDSTKVSVAQLVADPKSFEGKKVLVEGNVSAMCHHKRGWFSVVGNDQSGRHVRIITKPAFLVPEDAIGKVARAEGTVEIKKLPPEFAEHLKKEHKLHFPKAEDGAPVSILIRAQGSEFM